MKIKNILVSQPAPAVIEKSPYNEIITKYHVAVRFHPFIRVQGVLLKEFRAQRVEILTHTAVIFTSRTTIDSFFRICDEARITVPESLKYFCNTEAVALYLQKYIVYRKRKIFFSDGSFANFMELLNKHKDETFLLTLTEPHKPEMPLAMEKLRLKFDKVILARTVSADLSDIRIEEYDMLAFYSPTEIASLLAKFPGTDNKPRIATFGHSTTKTAMNEGLTVHVMAPSPEAPSMTKAIELYIKRVTAGEVVPVVAIQEQSPDQAYIQAQEAKPVKRRPATKSVGSSKTAVKSRPQTGGGAVAKSSVKPAVSKKVSSASK